MIELTLDTGNKVIINVDKIRSIYQQLENKCTIFFSDDDYVKPIETYTEVNILIVRERNKI